LSGGTDFAEKRPALLKVTPNLALLKRHKLAILEHSLFVSRGSLERWGLRNKPVHLSMREFHT